MCGKGRVIGGHITRKGLAKMAGGIGMHVVKNNKRTFNANIQTLRVKENGTVKKVKLCVACIRTGNFEKA